MFFKKKGTGKTSCQEWCLFTVKKADGRVAFLFLMEKKYKTGSLSQNSFRITEAGCLY